jgi:polysaccharide pyruvyl transferase WcaK-like protein
MMSRAATGPLGKEVPGRSMPRCRRPLRVLVEPSDFVLSNAGDSAMMLVALERMRNMWPDATIQVLTDDAERLIAYCPHVEPIAANGRHAWVECGALHPGVYRRLPNQLRLLSRTLQRRLKSSYPRIAKQLAKRRLRSLAPSDQGALDSYIEAIRYADLVIATGMSGITDIFPEYAFGLLGSLDLAIASGAFTALVGQGFGPLVSPDLVAMARCVLPKVDFVSLREGFHSLPLLERLGVPLDRVVTTGDDAIEIAYERRSESVGAHLGINIRRASYSAIRPSDIERLRTIMVSVIRLLRCPVLSVPVSQHTDESDSQSFGDLLSGHVDLSDKGETIKTPIGLIDQIRKCRLVIAGSYHAGVFALAQGVPVIGLAGNDYYSHKFEGLSHQFGFGCEVIGINEEGYEEKLRSAAIRMWKTAEEVRPQLLNRAAQQVGASRSAYEVLSQQAYSRIATTSD